MIHVLLSDPIVEVTGWTPAMDQLGAFMLRRRRSPQDIREAKREAVHYGRDPGNVAVMESIPGTVITYNPSRTIGRFLPGLWPRVKCYLDKNKIAYEVDDRRNPAIRPEPDYSCMNGVTLRKGQPEMLCKVINGDCGIIAASVGAGKSFIIALICKMYPTLNIVVTSNMVSVVNQLYKDIKETVGDGVGLLTGKTDKSAGAHIIVSTLGSLSKIPEDKVQLLLVDECHCLGAPEYSKAVANFKFARRFGFSATPVRNDGTQKVMESIVGPVVYRSTYEEGVSAGNVTPVKYTMLPCPKGPAFLHTSNMPDWQQQRWSYYRNGYRNRIIANAVYAIKDVFAGQILIVVSTVEHAIALHQLLPWFVVAHSDSFDPADMASKFANSPHPVDCKKYVISSKDNEKILAAFAKGTLRYLISTKILKQGLNMPHLRCLIRADATASEIDCFQIPGRLSRLDEGKEYAYLLDLDDTFIAFAKQKAAKRKAKYAEYKWEQISMEELLNDLERANRPGDPGFGPAESEEPEHGEAGSGDDKMG